jgi:hypothetical protein
MPAIQFGVAAGDAGFHAFPAVTMVEFGAENSGRPFRMEAAFFWLTVQRRGPFLPNI